jgi:hypothetical protein
MAIARDRAPLPRRRLFSLTVFIVAAAFLAFAGSAFAETKIGEGTSPEQPGLPGEADLLKGSVEYDVATGGLVTDFTTRAALESTPESEGPEVEYLTGLFDVSFPCSREGFEAEQKLLEAEGGTFRTPYPFYETLTFNGTFAESVPGFPGAQAFAYFLTQNPTGAGSPENLTGASRTISGTTTTVSATIPAAANQAFNCAEVVAPSSVEAVEPDFLIFPLTTKTAPTAVTPPPGAPAPAPAALSIAKAKKPPKLKRGKWTTVKVKVTNTGGTATTAGSLQVKETKGVVIKAARQKLPVLQPGGSSTVSYRVKLTAKAKKTSTLSLIGAAGSLAAKGSLVLKALG